MPFKWGGANEQTLRDNFGRVSAKEVAKLIPGATKNMVVGKAKRLGLVTDRPAHVYPRTAGMTAAVTRQARIPNPVGGRLALFQTSVNERQGGMGSYKLEPVAEVTIDLPRFICRAIGLLELRDNDCRWPLDNGKFCGLRRWVDNPYGPSPYCAPHHRLGHRPPSEHRRLGRR